MPTYQIHTITSAPEKSKPVLEQLRQAFAAMSDEMQRVHGSLQAPAFFRSTSKAIMLVL
jgi:hypothetical protein